VTNLNRLVNTVASADVLRYHAAPSVRPQTVGQHAHGVVAFVYYITGGEMGRQLLLECLFHDSAEIIIGDIPYTTKRDNPALREQIQILEDRARASGVLVPKQTLTDREIALLKIGDTLDGFVWCCKHEPSRLIRERWEESLGTCSIKFKHLLSREEWARVMDIHKRYSESPHHHEQQA
jgi:5'-deoxynucleotidase YfbR-like HD superfamily hydrolase